MDQNGVEDDVDNSTGGLGDHGVHGTAGGLQQTLAQNADEYTKRKDTADRRVGDTGFHSLGNGGLHLIIGANTEETEEHEKKVASDYARIFDIEICADNHKVEPAADVNLKPLGVRLAKPK